MITALWRGDGKIRRAGTKGISRRTRINAISPPLESELKIDATPTSAVKPRKYRCQRTFVSAASTSTKGSTTSWILAKKLGSPTPPCARPAWRLVDEPNVQPLKLASDQAPTTSEPHATMKSTRRSCSSESSSAAQESMYVRAIRSDASRVAVAPTFTDQSPLASAISE